MEMIKHGEQDFIQEKSLKFKCSMPCNAQSYNSTSPISESK